MKLRILFCLSWLGLLLGASGGAAWAQQPRELAQLPRPLTLPQALRVAQANYPALRSRQAAVRAAEADVLTNRATFLPQVTAQAQALNATANQVRGAYLPGVAFSESGAVKATGPDGRTNFSSLGVLAIEWPAVTFGRYRASENRSAAAVSAAQADYDQAVFEYQAQVADAYLLALGAEKAVALQRANLARAQQLARVIRAGGRSGIRPGIDSSTANAELARAQLQVLAAQQQARTQRTRLAGLLGQPTQEVQLDSMQFYSRLPLAGASPADTARATNPLLRVYRQRIVASQAQASLLNTNKRPSLNLLASTWGRGSGVRDRVDDQGNFVIDSSPGAGLPFKAYNYLLGATLTWRATELIHTGRAVQAQRLRTEQARADYDQQALQLETQLQNARLQVELAQQTALAAPTQLAAARQAYTAARARYDAGLDNLLVLTQATEVLNRAETDQALATNNLWRAVLLQGAAGGNLGGLLGQL
ncbi:TolC family protein [Hymenobacter sp. BRD128]|uniref:TolC family protein n=1 Tax=Hymenobacter sp. BRD128 TaxID=2675878 RepID=UPI001565B84D|nr:TolC family protein [Hymenobacter sp. BRD128]QKG58452.1 TolC family protein [Hymenobacter sp. BRD128]